MGNSNQVNEVTLVPRGPPGFWGGTVRRTEIRKQGQQPPSYAYLHRGGQGRARTKRSTSYTYAVNTQPQHKACATSRERGSRASRVIVESYDVTQLIGATKMTPLIFFFFQGAISATQERNVGSLPNEGGESSGMRAY